jgi:hypothetical protein
MGALLPNPNDLQVIAQLNQRFAGAQLAWMRARYGQDRMFGPGRSLRRSAWRLNIWPTVIAHGKARWLWFLQSGLSGNNQADIKTILEEGINNTSGNIVGILFDAVADSNLAINTYTVERQAILADTATQDIFLKIVLHCGSDIDPRQPGDASTPPAEGGETGGDHPSPFPALQRKTRKRLARGKAAAAGKPRARKLKNGARKAPARKGAAKRGKPKRRK